MLLVQEILFYSPDIRGYLQETQQINCMSPGSTLFRSKTYALTLLQKYKIPLSIFHDVDISFFFEYFSVGTDPDRMEIFFS